MVVSVIFALLFSLPISPPDSVALSDLGVEKALQIAYEHNPKINQLTHQIEAQRQQETLGLGIRNPEISYFREGIGEGTFSEQRWSVSQQLDFPLTSYYRYKSEQATTHSLELQLEALKLQVKRQVKSAYTTLAYAIQQDNLAQERVELFESLNKAARARADLGESSGIDAMQANLQLREAQNSLELADNQIMEARYDLFQTIGLDPEAQTYDISFPDTLRYVEIDVTQQEILQRLESHPQLKQIDREQRAAAYLTKAAKSTYFPDLSVSYYRQDFGGNYDFYGFEVGVSIPLWFGANTSKRVKQAKAQYRTVGWAFEDNYLLIKKQAEQAWHGYETSRTNIIRFRENIRDESIELVNMTQRGYRMGELDLLTLLEAQRTYLRTQEAYYQTLRNYYLRIIELEQYLQTDIIFNE